MFIRQEKIRLLSLCLLLSILVHCLALCAVRMFGSYRFGAAVGEAAVMVSLNDLQDPSAAKAQAPEEPKESVERKEAAAQKEAVAPKEAVQEKASAAPATPPAHDDPLVKSAEENVPVERQEVAAEREPQPAPAESAVPPPAQTAVADPPQAVPAAPVQPAAGAEKGTASAATSPKKRDYLFAKEEKLTYLISMLGVPIGSAELEAKNNERGTTITLTVRSNAAVSGIYPVDTVVETQHVDGRYVMTKIRQHEGSFKSDESFSINLEQKRVTLTDNLRYRNLRMTVPTDDVLDTLSGIYSLRNRPLQVGKTETLHIFDSEKYAEVPVEIVRKEETRLPNLTKVDTLVVRPQQKTAGIFRRTGDILIWMTDDANKVPVKIVTTIALGKVTAELVSAESQAHDVVAAGNIE